MKNTEMVGARIASLRRQANMTQKALADAVRMHPSSLNQIEKGKRSPHMKTVTRLAQALATTRDTILDGEPSKRAIAAEDLDDRQREDIREAVETALREALSNAFHEAALAIANGMTRRPR